MLSVLQAPGTLPWKPIMPKPHPRAYWHMTRPRWNWQHLPQVYRWCVVIPLLWFFLAGGGGMIDLQNDPFQKIISWYFLKILIPEWTFLMNQMICFSSWFLLRKHKKIISKGFKGLLQLKMNSLILPSSKLTNIPYQSSCTFEVRRFSMISKTLGYVIVSGRVWQSLITKSCLLRTYLKSALHHVKNLKLPPGWLLRVGYNPIKV